MRLIIKNFSLGMPTNILYHVLGVLSAMTSWYFNQSVLWAMFHWITAPFYLAYRLIKGSFSGGGFMEIINHFI